MHKTLSGLVMGASRSTSSSAILCSEASWLNLKMEFLSDVGVPDEDFQLTLLQYLENFLVLWWNPELIWLPMLRSDPRFLHYECQPVGFCRFWERIGPTSCWQLKEKGSKFILDHAATKTGWGMMLQDNCPNRSLSLNATRAALICIPNGVRIQTYQTDPKYNG